MSKNTHYSQELKDEVIARIKAGEATSDVAREKAIVPRLVYKWVANTTEVKSDKNYVLEIGKLNKEVSELYRLIGKLTADMSKKEDRTN